MNFDAQLVKTHLIFFFILLSLPANADLESGDGFVLGNGTSFPVTNSTFLNVTVNTSADVTMGVSSAMGNVLLSVYGGDGTVEFSIEGLSPSTTYNAFIGDYRNHALLTSDSSGFLSFTVSNPRFIAIQTTPSTFFLNDSVTGGNCTNIGTWNETTRTCTLSVDVNETIQIDNSSITIDCNNRTIFTNGTTGVFSNGTSNITIMNCNFINTSVSISLFGPGSGHRIENNSINRTIAANAISFATDIIGSSVVNNTIFNPALAGIFLSRVNSTNITGNTVRNLGRGLQLDSSAGNRITHNRFLNLSLAAGIFVRGIVVGPAVLPSNNNVFLFNELNSTQSGMLISGSGPLPGGPFIGSSNNLVANNTLSVIAPTAINVFRPVIFVNTGASDNVIENNTLTINITITGVAGGGAGGAIHFDVAADRNNVSNNLIISSGPPGINMDSGSGVGNNGHYWFNNTIRGAIMKSLLIRGNNNTVVGNTLTGSSGIRIGPGNGNIVRNNSFHQGGGSAQFNCQRATVPSATLVCDFSIGVVLSNTTNTTIEGNVFDTFRGDGIYSERDSSGIQASNNILRTVGRAGIAINSSTGIYSNNTIILNGTGIGINITRAGNSFFNTTVINSSTWILSNVTGTNFTNTTFDNENGTLNFGGLVQLGTSNVTNVFLNTLFNKAFVNSTVIPEFNTSARVSLKSVASANPHPTIDRLDNGSFVFCAPPECVFVLYAGGVFVIDVMHFTTYGSADSGLASGGLGGRGVAVTKRPAENGSNNTAQVQSPIARPPSAVQRPAGDDLAGHSAPAGPYAAPRSEYHPQRVAPQQPIRKTNYLPLSIVLVLAVLAVIATHKRKSTRLALKKFQK